MIANQLNVRDSSEDKSNPCTHIMYKVSDKPSNIPVHHLTKTPSHSDEGSSKNVTLSNLSGAVKPSQPSAGQNRVVATHPPDTQIGMLMLWLHSQA